MSIELFRVGMKKLSEVVSKMLRWDQINEK